MNTRPQNVKPTTIIRSGLRRPNWLCRNVKQTVVLVRDSSSSMCGNKAREASAANSDLVSELAQPVNKDGFNVAMVDFSTKSEIVHKLQPATTLDGRVCQISAGRLGGNTSITAGLEDASAVLKKAEMETEEGIVQLRPVIILFSDGHHNCGPPPHGIADRLKGKADLVTVAFGGDADEGLLRDLASTPQHFYRCSSGRELRAFLAAVGATMTATMSAGTNATQALINIQQ
jgi:uncharacterized protein YegL